MRHVVVAAIVLVVAGCGGTGSGHSPKAGQPATPVSFVDRIESACLERNGELRQLSRPSSQAGFAEYVASLLSIVRYYRGQLAALHPAGGERYFARYRRLLRADEASAVALLQAVRRRNRHAVARLVAEQRDRSALEQALLRRLRVSC